MILIAAVLDVAAFFGLTLYEISTLDPTDPNFSQYTLYMMSVVYSWGFGQCAIMVLLIPFILLFDYKKTYKNKMVDTVIPLAGILLMVLIYVEGLFEVAKFYIIKIMQEPDKGEPAALVKDAIKQIVDKIRK